MDGMVNARNVASDSQRHRGFANRRRRWFSNVAMAAACGILAGACIGNYTEQLPLDWVFRVVSAFTNSNELLLRAYEIAKSVAYSIVPLTTASLVLVHCLSRERARLNMIFHECAPPQRMDRPGIDADAIATRPSMPSRARARDSHPQIVHWVLAIASGIITTGAVAPWTSEPIFDGSLGAASWIFGEGADLSTARWFACAFMAAFHSVIPLATMLSILSLVSLLRHPNTPARGN